MTLAFACGFFVALSMALGVWVWYLYSQIAVLEDICAGMANGQMRAVPMDEWGE